MMVKMLVRLFSAGMKIKRDFYGNLMNSLVYNEQFIQVRCGAHVLNLVIHSGLKIIDEYIEKIKKSVKCDGSEM